MVRTKQTTYGKAPHKGLATKQARRQANAAAHYYAAHGFTPHTNKREESDETVEFLVGGKPYEVPISLLEGFPNTMLAKKAKSSSSSPAVLDRDPNLFAYCLNYMRGNGFVCLPKGELKPALVEELKFFGFKYIDETKITDESSMNNCIDRFRALRQASKRRIIQLEEESNDLQRKRDALDDEKQVLERAQEAREIEMELEKVVLKCLSASVDSTETSFAVDYSKDVYTEFVQNKNYFLDRISMLGLRVDHEKCMNEPYKVHLVQEYSLATQDY